MAGQWLSESRTRPPNANKKKDSAGPPRGQSPPGALRCALLTACKWNGLGPGRPDSGLLWPVSGALLRAPVGKESSTDRTFGSSAFVSIRQALGWGRTLQFWWFPALTGAQASAQTPVWTTDRPFCPVRGRLGLARLEANDRRCLGLASELEVGQCSPHNDSTGAFLACGCPLLAASNPPNGPNVHPQHVLGCKWASSKVATNLGPVLPCVHPHPQHPRNWAFLGPATAAAIVQAPRFNYSNDG